MLLDWIRAHPIPVIGGLLLLGTLLHMMAAQELKEVHPMDLVMRGLPFEDLTPRGQALEIGAWIVGLVAIAVIALVYLLPRLPV